MSKAIRVSFTLDEAKAFYQYLGGQIGELQSRMAIRDLKASAYASAISDLRAQQDRLGAAIMAAEAAASEGKAEA